MECLGIDSQWIWVAEEFWHILCGGCSLLLALRGETGKQLYSDFQKQQRSRHAGCGGG